MCNKNSTPPPTPNMKKTKKKIQQQAKDSSSSSSSSSSSLKPHRRRNRTKKRKPKYLSLRLQLSQNQSNQPNKATQPNNKAQLNLFPHQPKSPVVVEKEDDKEIPEENNVALLFSSDGGATLSGLLEDESTTVTAATSDDGSLSVLTCHEGLVRKAMRRRTRSEEGSEERWVCYSEVVEKKELTEEVTSSTATATTSFGSLSLKLDHEGILSAWSDKGSLYVAGEEAPQTVPDLLNNALLPNVAWDGYGCDVVGNTWKVPEDCTGANRVKGKEEMGWKLGQREASVLRYKEKRQNRLFSKRIRYEVRKLNAEKRPRMKGRFVKRE